MFTGLIEAVGEVRAVEPLSTGYRLYVATDLAAELATGQSLAVNGVCLTVIRLADGVLEADISPETARVTTLGSLRHGAIVNLERPLRADGRFGGHLVQGHVDAIGTVEAMRPEDDFYRLTVSFRAALAPYIVQKGSIAVDGISLTVARLGVRRFDVQIIPFTWEQTNLRAVHPGDPVNIECDLVGKYVVRLAELAGLNRSARTAARTH